MVAAPGVEQAAGVGHAGYTLWVFAVPMLLSALIEAPIALWSDRVPRRRLTAAALAVLAAALALCALPVPIALLSLGLALAGAASGVACGCAQAELVATHPGGAASAMSRWVAFAAAGDLVCPLVVAAALELGGSYRAALLAIAGLGAAQAPLLATRRELAPASVDGDDDAARANAVPLPAAVRLAAGQPRLWLLLLAAACCCLLDELVVALAALRLQRELGGSGAQVAAALTALSCGSLLGAVITERAVARNDPRIVLALSALASVAALALFVTTSSGAVAALALVLLGVAAAPHYPLVQAAAYELLPGRPGLVNALSELLVAVEVVLPALIGLIAARHGLGAALAALSLQPLIVLVAACGRRR